jgi:HEAT repeat protein
MSSGTNRRNHDMELRKELRMRPLALALVALGFVATATPAWGGRGSSPEAIRLAIESSSVDAISAELERSERLLCGSCVAMVRPLVDHQDARVRRVAGWWLARRGLRSELFVDMAYRLAQPDSIKARNAADVLGGLRYPRAVEPLSAALHNPIFAADARVAMAAALGRIGEPSAQPALRKALAAPEAGVRVAALVALRELRGPLDVAPALPLLRDRDQAVRAEALNTVGATRGQLPGTLRSTLVAALVDRLLADDSPAVRRKAAWALGEIGAAAEQAGQPLQVASRHDRDPAVRSLAHAALSRLAR